MNTRYISTSRNRSQKLHFIVLNIVFLLTSNFLTAQTKLAYPLLKKKERSTFAPQSMRIGGRMHSVSDSLKDGTFKLYSDSAMKMLLLTGEISNHQKKGTWIYYHPNGKKHILIPYKNNKIEGKMVRFNYSGDTCTIIPMVNDRASGRAVFWSDYNASSYMSTATDRRYVSNEVYFKEDAIISETTYYPSGAVLQKEEISSDTLVSSHFSRQGNLLRKTYYMGRKIVKEDILENKSPETTYEKEFGFYSYKVARETAKIDSLPLFTNLEKLVLMMDAKTAGSDSLVRRILTHAASLKHLETLIILTPKDFDASLLSALGNLKHLNITCNGAVNQGISKLVKLEYLVINGNEQTSGTAIYTIPATLSQLKNLHTLQFNKMKFADPSKEIAKLSKLKSLKTLKINNCGLAKFPVSIAGMQNIRFLDFGGTYGGGQTLANTFTSLPDTVFKMKNLRYMMLPGSFGYANPKVSQYMKKMPLCSFDIYFSCFPAGTMIQLANGNQKAIEHLQKGDLLLCLDETDRNVRTTEVLETGCQETSLKRNIKISLSGSLNTLEMTSEHPVFVVGKGWVNAGDLQSGDQVYLIDASSQFAQAMRITAIEDKMVENITFYNIKTSEHTYFANGIWVHNK